MPVPELFLSQVRLDPRRREVQRALADSQALHQLVLSLFPVTAGGGARQTLGVLYRVDRDAKTGVPLLLIQSGSAPDWQRFAAPGGIAGSPPESKERAAAYDAIRRGQTLRFRLRANPTRRVPGNRPDDPLAGKRVNLRTDEQRRDWLARKLRDEAGCVLLGCTIGDEATQRGTRDGQRVSHGAVRYDGVLRVEDPEALRAAIRAGIGAGKAYGFGLLSVAPMPVGE